MFHDVATGSYAFSGLLPFSTLLLGNNRCSLDAYQIPPLVHIHHSISA
jgi:hypothetical protein